MKIHLAWIRVTVAAAIVVGVGVHPAAAQYAPFKPIPPDPVAPQVTAPMMPQAAYRTQPVYQQAPTARYQVPATAYQQPVTPYQPAAAAPYTPAVSSYPQTAARYPAAYGSTPYVATQQPTEALPAPQAHQGSSMPTTETMPATDMQSPVEQGMPSAGVTTNGYPTADCNCGNGGYSAGSYYGAGRLR